MPHVGNQVESREVLTVAVFAVDAFKIIDGVIGRGSRITGAVIPNHFSAFIDKPINIGRSCNHWVIGLQTCWIKIKVPALVGHQGRNLWADVVANLIGSKSQIARGRSGGSNVACGNANWLHEATIIRITLHFGSTGHDNGGTSAGHWALIDFFDRSDLVATQTRGGLGATAHQGLR